MTPRQATRDILDIAIIEQRCAYGQTTQQVQALRKLWYRGVLTRPYCGLFLPTEYWNSLSLCEQTLHIMRALHIKHPSWVFTGLSAACAYEIAHPWILHDGSIQIVGLTNFGKRTKNAQLTRFFAKRCDSTMVQGIPVVPISHMTIDCMRQLPFHHALGIVDSALNRNLTIEDLQQYMRAMHAHGNEMEIFTKYANPHSMNYAESLARAIIILLGFKPPQVHVRIDHPYHANLYYYADLFWELDDGSRVVVDMDSRYLHPCLVDHHTINHHDPVIMDVDHFFRICGIQHAIHLSFEELTKYRYIADVLEQAGVPRTGVPFLLQDDRHQLISHMTVAREC